MCVYCHRHKIACQLSTNAGLLPEEQSVKIFTLHPRPHQRHWKRVSKGVVKGAKRDIRNVVELERVVVFRGGNDTDPVPQAVLLQELFGEILEVSLGEGDVGGDGDLVVPIADNLDVLAKLADLALDLDAVVQELFKVCAIEDTVRGRLRVVDDELVLGGGLLGGGSGLEGRR